MDKWLQKSTNKTQQTSSKQEKQKKQQIQQAEQDRIKEEHDLQLALEESRLASDIEKAIAISLRESDQYSSSRLELPTAPAPTTVANTTQYTSTNRLASTSSAATKRITSVGHRNRTNIISPSATAAASSSDTWAVDAFVNDLLNQSMQATIEPTSSTKTDYPWYVEDLETTTVDLEDDDATTDDDGQQDAEKEGATDDDWELVYDPDTDVLYEESSSSPVETGHTSLKKLDWHDEQAEDLFFGQFRRETWDKDQIRSAHGAMKKRSMATVIKKNKTRRTNSSHTSSTSNHDYYTTADDVLEDAFEAAGFGDSAAGLSWEGVGQSRYT